MFQSAENASHKLRADLILQYEIDWAPCAQQGMLAIEKIARCAFGLPNPYGLSPHGSEPRNDDTLRCAQPPASLAPGEARLGHNTISEACVGWGDDRSDALQTPDRQTMINQVLIIELRNQGVCRCPQAQEASCAKQFRHDALDPFETEYSLE